MISIHDLTIHFGEKTLFENVNLQLDHEKRYGLVGANGSGKTTFLNLLTATETSHSGKINLPREITIGYLSQDQFSFEKYSAVETVISGNKILFSAQIEKNAILQTTENSPESGEKLGKLEEIIANNDGYSAEARACRLLDGLGIETEKHFAPMKNLSGGYKLRVLLARTLFQNPSVLLLDEPTNHLDIFSIAWLEDYLKNHFKGMLVVISHDRHFINSVANHILDVDFNRITLYRGNYDHFMESKTLLMEQKLRENIALEKKIDQMQAFVERFRAKASKARQAQSRIKQIEKVEIPEIISTSRRYPGFKFEQCRPTGKTVLKIKNIRKSFGNQTVLNNISFQVLRGQKIALVGPNGIGKSTLIKIISGQLNSDLGTVKWGIETYPSYFAQDYRDNFNRKGTAFEWLFEQTGNLSVAEVRGLLGRVLLGEEEANKKIINLSGGESARLALAHIMAKKPNVLLLDEPTNHLDLESISALEDALIDFEGSCILVSHDKSFVSSVADTILELSRDGLTIYSGSYHEYLENLGHDYLIRSGTTTRKAEKKELSSHQQTYLSRKEQKKQLERLQKNIKFIEDEINVIEGKLGNIMKLFASNEFYQNPFDIIKHNEDEKERLTLQLNSKIKEWESLNKEYELSKIAFQ